MTSCFWLCRRSCSLDVEISASGFTKAMQQDDELLHPEGPEGAEDHSDDEEEPSESAAESADPGPEEALDLEEYKQAMLELEGLRLGEDSKAGQPDPNKHQTDCGPDSQRDPVDKQTDNQPESQSEVEHNVGESDSRTEALQKEDGGEVCTSPRSDEELEEEDDECPDLVDLSALNKEFKPFRYMNDFSQCLNFLAIQPWWVRMFSLYAKNSDSLNRHKFTLQWMGTLFKILVLPSVSVH